MKTLITLLSCSLLACTASDPVDRNTGKADAGVAVVLEAPAIEVVPSATPGTTVAIRGSAGGQRVVVSGGPDITAETGILPSGNFCHDATLEQEGVTELEVYTVDGNGSVSDPIIVEVVRDSSAPMPLEPTCSGAERRVCEEAEVCSAPGDEDCDGFENSCDSDCNGCQDDAYEPNDGPNAVPYLPGRGAYDLELCPCRPDWFAFYAQEGERIRVRAEFDSAAMNLNMRLYPSETPDGSNYVDSAFGSTSIEEIDYTAEASGIYYLNVYVFSTDEDAKRGSYTLSIL